MGIKQDFVKKSVETIMSINPSFDKEMVEKTIKRMMKEKLRDPNLLLDNNVTGASETRTLTELCTYLDKEKPIISGNATFYEQPDVVESPTSNMLRTMKKSRSATKKKMYQAANQGDMDLYKRLDLSQYNDKVVMNAEYGGSGAPTAAFYTKYSPAATTLMAQSIITTMAAFFEGYIGDNMKYYNINECIDWMNRVKEKEWDIPKWMSIPSKSETQSRIRSHFMMINIDDAHVVDRYIENCSTKELVYIFYANNMKEFIRRHPKIQNIIHDILTTLPTYEASEKDVPNEFKDRFVKVNDYNKWVSEQMFLNPYKPPESIKPKTDKLSSIIKKFCYVRYLTPDSIIKLNNHKRNTVLLVDTDSNVLNSNIFVTFVMDELFPGSTFGRSRLYNDMINVNMLATIIDPCVVDILDYYCECHNIREADRSELTMKNEYMFRTLFLMDKKKRYAASIALREGNIMMPFKTEIKGVEFIKAGVTDEVEERFTEILEKYILFSNELDLHGLMTDVHKFEKEILEDLRNGGVRYLKPQSYKAEGAYKMKKDDDGIERSHAWSLPVFRAAAVWNELYPLQKIYSMDRIKLIKLTITRLEDMDRIKDKYPDEYELVKNRIFKSTNPEIVTAGLKIIGIPSTVETIPPWIVEFIDYDNIISDVVASFRSILEALGIEEIHIKTPNGKANIQSSLVSI